MSARARRMLRWVPGAMLATRWLSQAFVELDVRGRRSLRRHLPEPQSPRRRRRTQASARGRGSGRAREADPALQPRLQAAQLPQRVHPHLQSRQRAARDRRHRGDHADRGADRRRRRAPDRRAGPRDRLQGLRHRQHAAVRDARSRRRRARAVVEREPTAGLRGGQRARASRTGSRSSGRTASTGSPTSG